MFTLKRGLIIYINTTIGEVQETIKMKNYEYEYKSYIKYEKYKYIVIEFWDTINWIHTKRIDYTQE